MILSFIFFILGQHPDFPVSWVPGKLRVRLQISLNRKVLITPCLSNVITQVSLGDSSLEADHIISAIPAAGNGIVPPFP